MNLVIEDLVLDEGLQAQASQELEGFTTFTIPDTAYVRLQVVEKFVYVRTLFVTTSKRRQGIGSGLLKTIEKAARESGLRLIGLSIDPTHKDPEAALAFAKSLGFKIKESGTGPNHIGLTKALLYSVPTPSDPSQTREAQA
jgi:GNAT superfamily N-acetyltransferase